jgi:hypothetical protein
MRFLALAVGLFGLLAATPPRDLVYAYTFESDRADEADKAYGVDKMDPGGGGTFIFHNVNQHFIAPGFDGPQSRSGRIDVRLLREESDGGIVVSVSESPATANGPLTCVAFGDTTVVCDPSRPVPPEVSTLVATLGQGFVDAARLDAARHWHVAPEGTYGTAADYAIVRSTGNVLEISENGVRTQSASPLTTTIGAKIEYDSARSIPITLDATTVEHAYRGAISETISTHVMLTLEADAPLR